MKGSIFLLGFSLFPKWNFSKEKWNAEKRKKPPAMQVSQECFSLQQ